jgi:hypothetical protein
VIPERCFRRCSKLTNLTIENLSILRNSAPSFTGWQKIGRHTFSSID